MHDTQNYNHDATMPTYIFHLATHYIYTVAITQTVSSKNCKCFWSLIKRIRKTINQCCQLFKRHKIDEMKDHKTCL